MSNPNRLPFSGRQWRWLFSVLAMALPVFSVRAADIYGYVDARGVAHFAAEKVDRRYLLFFRGGKSFDTADGVAPIGTAGPTPDGTGALTRPSAAARTLIRLVESAPGYKVAKTAVADAAKKHAVDLELLQALIATESGFDAQAVSPRGALGLMQLMPDTAARYGVRPDGKRSVALKLFDPRVNVAAGARYLADLIDMFPNRLELALAAYNAGEGAVQRAGNQIPNYPETRNYVKTVMQLYAYLKPSARVGNAHATGAVKEPTRVRMELNATPVGGAIGRGNLPVPTAAGSASLWADRPTEAVTADATTADATSTTHEVAVPFPFFPSTQ